MAQAKIPTPTGGYREGNNICFTWNRNTPPAYNHFDLSWGVYYAGGWDEDSNTIDSSAKDPLSYFTRGSNRTGEVENYGNYASSSYAKAFSPDDWYPFHNRICAGMWFQVRGDSAPASEGNANNTRSLWSASKPILFQRPSAPAVSATRNNGAITFRWQNNDGENSLKWCSEVQVQTKIGSGGWVTLAQDTTWESGTSVTSSDWRETAGSCVLTESEYNQSGVSSLTRSFRARSRGPYGASAWAAITAWTWAKPNTPVVYTSGSGRTSANDRLAWSYSTTGNRPAEELIVQRCVGTPTTSAEALPSNPSWTSSDPVSDPVKGVTGIPVGTVGLDECVWMRATAKHGELSTTSKAIVTYRGRLKAPTGLTASQSGTTVTLTWTNHTTVPGAQVRVSHRGVGNKNWVAIKTGAATGSSALTSYTITNVSSGTVWDYKVEAVKDNWITSEASAVYNLGRPGKPTITDLIYREKGKFVTVYWSDPDTATTNVELAWSTSRIAWDSTTGYNSKTIVKRKAYNIDTDVDPGSTLYVRVRFLNDDSTGSWSDTESVVCATTPETPVLEASKTVVQPGENVQFAWSYSNGDGSLLDRSVLYITYDGTTTKHGVSNGKLVGNIYKNQWLSGSSVSVTVAVTSANGVTSEQSDPVVIQVLAAPTPVVALGYGSTWTVLPYTTSTGDSGASAKVRTLKTSPLRVRIGTSGAVAIDEGTVTIRREGDYRIEHADGTVSRGADGERVAVGTFSWTSPYAYVSFYGVDFDDGCLYRAEVEAENEAGSSVVLSEPFRVEWTDKANAPTATARANGLTAVIRPVPADSTEMCDVYRVTADGLQLVMANAEWSAYVVDPYAPLGKHGATHRIVSRTTTGSEAWIDVDAGNEQSGIVIDWDEKQITLPYDVTLSDGYSKDYTSTRHRGGTITGKWLEGVERSATWNSQIIRVGEQDKLILLRELAQWTGECYLRSPQGVGFPCSIEIGTMSEFDNGAVGITITAYRLDSDLWGGEYQ